MKDTVSKKFLGVTLLNLLITIVEFIGGTLSGSLSLLSDAIHNLGDTGSIVLSFIAHIIGKRRRNIHKTFGYKRAEILAAFTNAVALIVITVFLLLEAGERFIHPTKIDGRLMLLVAIIGLAANFASMLIMAADSKHNLNIRSTFLHMLSDAVSSVGVILAAVAIRFWHIYWLDPVMTVVVALIVMREAFKIVRDSINILMESNPDIDLNAVKTTVMANREVENIHHVHVWQYSDEIIMLDAHLNVKENMTVGELEPLYDKISDQLYNKFRISHVTLQAECDRGLTEKMIDNTQDD